MSYVTGLVCVRCGRRYEERAVRYTCPACGIEGILDVLYDYEAVGQKLTKARLREDPERTPWRYLPLLPLADRRHLQPLTVGWTPIYDAPRLATRLGVSQLLVKDEGRNPTASFKDRASSVGVARALEQGESVITCASTGNAASSLAGFAAAAGLPATIFVPETVPQGKVAQLLIFGATVVLVEGGYEKAFDLCQQAVAEWGWYNRSCAVNPYLVEGKKTAGLELCEQLEWDPPDRVFVSVGDGCTIAGIWKGISEWYRLGLIARRPRLVGVQAEGCQPIKRAWERRGGLEPEPANTLADSIAVSHPRNWIKARRAVEESGGCFVAVSDAEILAAMRELATATGVFTEPAGAAAYAGLARLGREGALGRDERVLVMATGNGLKDVAGALKAVGAPLRVPADLEALRRALATQGRAPAVPASRSGEVGRASAPR